jgi:hypothetical protein
MAKQYSNRSDLRNPAAKMAKTAVPGQAYGEAGAQLASQSVVPMAGAAPSAAPAPAPSQGPSIAPGALGPLNRPTERPNEPLTAGASFGPGPTPGVQFVVPKEYDPILNELRGLYQAYPSPELADMLDSYVREGY